MPPGQHKRPLDTMEQFGSYIRGVYDSIRYKSSHPELFA
jgi:hypothetical protein